MEGVAEPVVEPRPESDGRPARPALGRLVGRGAAWSVASNLVMRGGSIAVTAVLARLLSPSDFGTFAIALAFFLVLSSLAELGLGSAIARSADEPEQLAPTVVTVSVAGSALLAVLMFVAAGPIASTLGQPDAADPLRVLSLSLFLTGVFTVPAAQLVREFRQDRVFLATLTGFLVSNPILVLLALAGGGATAFAWSRVVGQVAAGLVMYVGTTRRYRPGWRPEVVRGLLGFGLPLALANLVNYALLNADYLIVGRLADAAVVGVYMIAFNVASWSTALMGSVLNTVVVPAFGRVGADREGLSRALGSAGELVALVALPVAGLSVVLARPLVEVLFGSRWSDAAPVLAVLAVYGALYSFTLLLANVLVAVGATRRLLAVQLAWVSALVPSMVVGFQVDGLRGAAWAHVVTIACVALPGYGWAVARATGLGPRAAATHLVRPALAAAAATLAAWLVAVLLPGAGVADLLAGGLVGLVVHLAVAGPVLARYLPASVVARLPRSVQPAAHPGGAS